MDLIDLYNSKPRAGHHIWSMKHRRTFLVVSVSDTIIWCEKYEAFMISSVRPAADGCGFQWMFMITM